MIANSFFGLQSLASAMIATCLWFSIATAESLISYEQATPAGLERTWFGQVQVDVSRHRVRSWRLYKDNLLAVTTSGLIHSFDAETGETLWTSQPGPLDQPVAGPALNDKYVAVVSAAEIYVMDSATGKFQWNRSLGSAPAAGPALSDTHVFVSFFNGRIEAYRLENPQTFPWYAQSVGRIHHSPTTTGEVVSWPTDRGYIYVGKANEPRVLYRIETASPATAPPSGSEGHLFVTSADGHLYCFNEFDGDEVWRYSMGYTSSCRAAVVGDRVYIASSEPMLHALDSKTGQLLWNVPGITQFAAQGLKNVYGLDDLGRLLVVDKESGKYIATLPGVNHQAVFNDQSDRIFLVNDRGLVQCLHEIGADEPTMHRRVTPPAEEEKASATAAEVPPAEAAPIEPTVPEGEEPAEEAEPSPFQEEGGEDIGNPFSFGE